MHSILYFWVWTLDILQLVFMQVELDLQRTRMLVEDPYESPRLTRLRDLYLQNCEFKCSTKYVRTPVLKYDYCR